jgi:hypothetical protein
MGPWAHGPIANARTQHGNNTDNKNKNLGQACLPEVHGEIGKGTLPIQIHIRSRFGSSTPPSRAPPPRDPMSSDESEIPGRAVDQPDSIAEGTSLSSQGNIQIDKEIPPGQPAPATPASEAEAHLHRVMDEAEDLQKEGQQDIEGMTKFEKELEQLFDDLKSTSTGPRSVASTLSDEDATKDEELERAHAAGLVKSNDVMGFRFTRAKKASLAMTLEYEQCTTASQKANMRVKWMEGKYQKYSQEREKKTTSSTADLEWGTYEPFEVMCGNESATGVTATGVRAGFNIAKTCLEIGGKWVRRNNFSKRIEFLRPKAGYKDKFEKAWAVTVKEKKIEANPGEDNLPEGPKKKAKKTDVKKTDGEPPAKKTVVTAITPKKALLAAQKSAGAYCSAVAMGDALLKMVDSQSSWQWARSPENSGPLKEALKALKGGVESGSFVEDLITSSDVKSLKGKFSKSDFDHEVQKVAGILDPLVAEATRQVNILKTTQDVRNKM